MEVRNKAPPCWPLTEAASRSEGRKYKKTVATVPVFILLASPLGLKPRFRPLVTPGKSQQEESETPQSQ